MITGPRTENRTDPYVGYDGSEPSVWRCERSCSESTATYEVLRYAFFQRPVAASSGTQRGAVMGYARCRGGAFALAFGLGAATIGMPGIAFAGPNPDSSANANTGAPAGQSDNNSNRPDNDSSSPGKKRISQPDKKSEVSSLSPNDDGDNAPPSKKRTTTYRPRAKTTTTCPASEDLESEAPDDPKPQPKPKPESGLDSDNPPTKPVDNGASKGAQRQNPSPQQRRAAFEGAGPSATVGTASVSTQEDEEPTLTTTEVSLTSQSRLSEAPVLFSAGARDLPPARESFVSVATNLVTVAFSPSALSGPEAPIESPLIWAVFAFARRPQVSPRRQGRCPVDARAPTG